MLSQVFAQKRVRTPSPETAGGTSEFPTPHKKEPRAEELPTQPHGTLDESDEATQPQCSQEVLEEPSDARACWLLCLATKTRHSLADTCEIGRGRAADVPISNDPSVSAQHARLVREDGDDHRLFSVSQQCFVSSAGGEWRQLGDQGHLLRSGDRFALQRLNGDADGAPKHVFEYQRDVSRGDPPSRAFDEQYIELIARIRRDGEKQDNKKGVNRTLGEEFVLSVDLDGSAAGEDDEPPMALPLTTLRQITPRLALVEAMWYLRGEETIAYLQRRGCRFWDKQAIVHEGIDGWVGLGYGLLVRSPHPDGSDTNPLEAEVLAPLIAGKCSRNMYVSLDTGDAKTVQKPCTSGVQFTVRPAGGGRRLDLTLHQRSSDVAVGLPFDVVVWATILHLVCREVRRRAPDATIFAGRLTFNLASAHIYDINANDVDTVAERAPLRGVESTLVVCEAAGGMFDIAGDDKCDASTPPLPGKACAACKERFSTMLSVDGYVHDELGPRKLHMKQAS